MSLAKFFLSVITCSLIGTFTLNAQVDLSDYEKTNSGLYYKFYVKNEDAPKAKSGDMITLELVHKNDKDSVLYSSGEFPYPYTVSMMASKGNADLYEALEMMSLGDSASFVFDAETYYKNTFGTAEIPPYINKGSKMVFEIKILDFKTKSEMAFEQMKMIEGQIKEEEQAIQKYVKANNITVKPGSSGLYFIEQKEGTGKKAEEGNLVHVNYTMKLLKSGKVVESTSADPSLKEMNLVPRYVMPGLIEGITKMKEGGRAMLIIPSHLAYGASGSMGVPPNSPLVFEIELIEVFE